MTSAPMLSNSTLSAPTPSAPPLSNLMPSDPTLPDGLNTRIDDMAYGCLFCRTNKEQATALAINRQFPQVHSIIACKEKHKVVNGRMASAQEVFLPGYVFFEAPRDMNVLASLRSVSDNIHRVLHDSDGNWELLGDDKRFALWLFHYDGIIGLSSAYREGDRIRIASGPLKDMEGHIIRVNKRARRAEISIEFISRTIDTWLSFELFNPIDAPLKGLVEGDKMGDMTGDVTGDMVSDMRRCNGA